MSSAMSMKNTSMTTFRSRNGTWMVTGPMYFGVPPMPCTDPHIPDRKDARNPKESQYWAYYGRDMMERQLAHVSRQMPRNWSHRLPTRCECIDKSAMGVSRQKSDETVGRMIWTGSDRYLSALSSQWKQGNYRPWCYGFLPLPIPR